MAAGSTAEGVYNAALRSANLPPPFKPSTQTVALIEPFKGTPNPPPPSTRNSPPHRWQAKPRELLRAPQKWLRLGGRV